MISWTALNAPPDVVQALQRARELLQHVATHDKTGEWITCHSVAAALLPRLPASLRLCHGYFGEGRFEHSWLAFCEHRYVLDLYPSGADSGPLLVDVGVPSPWTKLYREAPLPDDRFSNEQVAWINEQIERAETAP